MGEIFRELQEESKERETRGAFERWLTEKRGTPLLLEQTQAYEAFKAGMKHYGCMTAVRMFQAEEAALAQPETAEPVAWLNRYRAAIVTQDHATAVAMGFTTPLYTHPPRDEWRPASEPPEDGRDVVVWMDDGGHGCFASGHCVRGEWTPNYVGSPVTHWRDIDGPTEGA